MTTPTVRGPATYQPTPTPSRTMRPTQLLRQTTVVAACALGLILGNQAFAQAQEKYLGEVFLFASNFCPQGSMVANGALIPVQQNAALFAILGTFYGGNGTTNFALPDLQGRSPIGAGQGPGLSNIALGQKAGSEQVTLSTAQLPLHSHTIAATNSPTASTKPATHTTPNPTRVPAQTMNAGGYVAASEADTTLAASAIASETAPSGGGQEVKIRNPYLGMTWCIVVNGVFPSRQ
ncbi:hypothetical protein E9531_10910 [Lampropedia puyangensis]|uniref:Phage tail collar domain-containing protein n=1 Tax=Lampropedia puyangensis TaxID=1330072 RepID=A0A4S8F075_9BURK|nr:tail fiber protein [Lampropedia puyangensis]THU00269.1 hypothetical protein E9531_10910 [Lampropedia puyangensis]